MYTFPSFPTAPAGGKDEDCERLVEEGAVDDEDAAPRIRSVAVGNAAWAGAPPAAAPEPGCVLDAGGLEGPPSLTMMILRMMVVMAEAR